MLNFNHQSLNWLNVKRWRQSEKLNDSYKTIRNLEQWKNNFNNKNNPMHQWSYNYLLIVENVKYLTIENVIFNNLKQ